MKKIKIYIASGWFDEYQDKALTYIEELLLNNELLNVYSPRKNLQLNIDADVKEQDEVFLANVNHILDADFIIASTVGKDMGTLWETGFAYASNIPIIYTFFDERFKDAKFNLMLAASGIGCFTNKQEFEKAISNLHINDFQIQNFSGEIE